MTTREALVRAVIALVLFGGAPTCIKAASMNSAALGIARLGVAAAAMTALLIAKGKFNRTKLPTWPGRQWSALAAIGVLFGLHWLFYFLSIKMAGAALGSICFSTYGIQLVALGWVLRTTSMTPLDLTGVMVAMGGTGLIIAGPGTGEHPTLGIVIGILSGTWYAFLPILHQRFADIDVDVRTWAQFTFAWPVFLVLAPWSTWHGGAADWAILLYMSVVITLGGHVQWVKATTTLSTTATSVLSYLYAPLAMAGGWLLLDEEITGRMMGGAACIITGNAITLWSRARRKALRAGT